MVINKKFFNWSAWITLLITYVLPYQSTDRLSTDFGYPLPFLTVYKTSINSSAPSLLMLNNINPLTLTINILIVYFVINSANALLVKMKSNRDMIKTKDE